MRQNNYPILRVRRVPVVDEACADKAGGASYQ